MVVKFYEYKISVRRGRRYGLLGHNGCGIKFMEITTGQLEGFPESD